MNILIASEYINVKMYDIMLKKIYNISYRPKDYFSWNTFLIVILFLKFTGIQHIYDSITKMSEY